MNVKRYLEKQARKDRRAIMEADGGKTLRALGIDYPESPKKNRRLTGWLIGAASVVASLVLIVCLVIFYPAQSQTIYWEANFETRTASLTELNSEMHDFTFEIDESAYSVRLTRTSDSVSNDLLYYTVSLDSYDSIVKMELVAVCNSKFEYKNFDFPNEPISKSLPLYNILYNFETLPKPQFGLDMLSCTAEIDGEKDIVYVKKYEELLVGPETVFFDVIQQVVQPVK